MWVQKNSRLLQEQPVLLAAAPSPSPNTEILSSPSLSQARPWSSQMEALWDWTLSQQGCWEGGVKQEQELANDSERQGRPGCRHSLCKGPGQGGSPSSSPTQGASIYKGIFLILGRSTVSGTPALPERRAGHASAASRFERKPGNVSPRLWGCRGIFVNGTICRATPGQMGGTPPSLPSHSHGHSPWYTPCTHAPVCRHACELTLSVSPAPTQACY